MAKEKKAPPAAPGAPLYMATYGDMVTLVLCFFVLLFAMSSVDAKKFEAAAKSLRISIGSLKQGSTLVQMPADPNTPAVPSEESEEPAPPASDDNNNNNSGMDTNRVAQALNSYLNSEGLDKSIQVTINQRGIAVSISDQFLFDSGKADLKLEGQRALYKIAALVRDVVPAISVEGHTDAVPLRGGAYRDNWGLSAIRAAVIASYLETDAGVDPKKLQAVGYGAFHPAVPNDTPEHRALNRRVILMFLSQYPK